MALTPTKFLTDNNLDISRGLVRGVSHVNKFGYIASLGGSFQPITDLGTNFLPTSASVLSISSNSAEDDPLKSDSTLGTGAWTLNIQGLDSNFDLIEATINLNGTSAVLTTGVEFIRVFRAQVVTAGSTNSNVGVITITHGGTSIMRISAATGQSLKAAYTVPRGKKAYLTKFQANLEKAKECVFEIRIKNGADNAAWNVKARFGSSGDVVEYNYQYPLEIAEKTDIEIRGKAGATTSAGALFDILLVDTPVDRNIS